MDYQDQQLNDLHDAETYWVKYWCDYIGMWGDWTAQTGATIKIYSKGSESKIKGPIPKPEN